MSLQIHEVRLAYCRCWLIQQGNTCVLVDAGTQPARIDNFRQRLAELKVAPESIKLILLSHGHLDHIGVLADIQKLTGAPIALHQKDLWLVEEAAALRYQPPGINLKGRMMSVAGKALMRYMVHIEPVKVNRVLGDEGMSLLDYFGEGVDVVYTPGHSWGSVTVVIQPLKSAIVGDLANNAWWLSHGLPALGEDLNAIKESWRTLLKRYPDLETIYVAHGNPFNISLIKGQLGL